jgi:uncharacterized membrane protein
VSLAPLLAAPPLVQIHAAAALVALVLGAAQFAAPKGTRPHRLLGYGWAGLMALVALSSFGITGVGGEGRWSWIHLISVYTLGALGLAVWQARRGQIRAHRMSMISLYLGALVITGAFTLLPGRRMGAVVFGW